MAWIGAKVDYHFRELPDMWGGRGAFNGQIRRLEMMRSLLEALQPQAIVETGTFLGSTTDWFAGAAGATIYTVEVNPRFYFYARTRLRARRNIKFHRGDSRAFLLKAAADPNFPRQSVLFYLDAHAEGNQPLAEELTLIERHWRDSVVVVDDFRIDDDSGYGFDQGSDWHLGMEMVPLAYTAYLPACGSDAETGGRRGAAILACGEAANLLAGMKVLRPVASANTTATT